MTDSIAALQHWHGFTCPYCWQQVEVPLELYADENDQVLFMDCPNCCHPVLFHIHLDHRGEFTIQSGRDDD